MAARRSVSSKTSTRTWSLRREWSHAFVIMLVLQTAVAAVTVIGVRSVMAQVQGAARQLGRESAIVSTLSGQLEEHEETAHQLLSGKPVDRAAFLADQQVVSRTFAQAAQVFPPDHGLRADVLAARRSWEQGLQQYGLWGPQIDTIRGNHSKDNPAFGGVSDNIHAMLDATSGPSQAVMNADLDRGETFQRWLIIGLSFLFALALAATVHFRRRMTRDLVAPVASLHEGVVNLRAGRYDHRIPVARKDELGELAEAFNGMAAALLDSHTELTFRASHDILTGLANRATLTDQLLSSFTAGADHRAQHESLLFIDIDDFKNVNDSLGHEGGDTLLIQLAGCLRRCVRSQDLVARLGGDEFAVIVRHQGRPDVAVEVAERILDALREPLAVSEARLQVNVSIGIAERTPDTADAAELLRQADFAMYMAKGAGKNRYRYFDAQLHDDMITAIGPAAVPRRTPPTIPGPAVSSLG